MNKLLNRFGDYLLENTLESECKKAGLVRAAVQCSFGTIEYLRSNNEAHHSTEAIVMLHGAAADKTSWIRFSKYLGSKYQLVISDLPGHGKSVSDSNLDYSITAQTERVKAFISTLGIKRAHLIGNSMGGTIAVRLASTSPTLVASLVLIDTAGFEASPSWLRQHVAHTGTNPMIEIRDASDYRAMMRIGMESPPYIPGIIISALARAFIKRKTINQKIAKDIEQDIDQTERLSKIVAPVLILWGSADKVEHIDNAEFLHQHLANSRKIVMNGVGHVPMVEAPKEVAAVCGTFFAEQAP